jgi:ATP-dependent DNA helicase RecG
MEKRELEDLKGIGPSLAKTFESIGIRNLSDLLHYYPRQHEDYSVVTKIAKIRPGTVTLKARIKQVKGRYVRRGMYVTEAVASDDTGSVRLVWFNQPYREGVIKNNEDYFITGKLELKQERFAILNPSIELARGLPVHTARIVPIYRESRGVGAQLIRKVMAEAFKLPQLLPEVLPEPICKDYRLMGYEQAIRELHFPSSADDLAEAKRTLGFLEVFELMLASQINKQEIESEVAPVIEFDEAFAKKFVGGLPFKLTDAQRKAAWQMLKDLERDVPANRLLEGDVGSGKTVIAAMAAAMTMHTGMQAALLAPTELLARQHADSLMELLKPVGMDTSVSLLVGSHKASQKQTAHKAIETGRTGLMVGTHALLQDKVRPKQLGLLIIDEQHRFGVEQRKSLLKSMGKMPHVLSMTATPIPRSLALTLYGELDISLLDAMPPGRRPIITSLVSPNSREKMERHVSDEISKGHQVYVVCPLISESSLVKTVSAEATYERLAQRVFKNRRVALLHGKLKNDEKTAVMERFVAGETDILVATTVIEVGVNVPNATVMIIEGADRFGLAQLHQLRGRVGRSSEQGYCYIVPSDSKAPSKRLRAITQSSDGFLLAEMDLELRGPGAIYGTLQHGELDLRFANLTDQRLLAEARQAVRRFIDDKFKLQSYPELKKRVRLAQAVITLN